MNIRHSKILVTILSIVLFSSCSLVENFVNARQEYREYISHLAITEDGKNIIFFGENFHYIFESDSVLIQTINSPLIEHVSTPSIGDFVVSHTGTTTGVVSLQIYQNAPISIQDQAGSLGYVKSGDLMRYRIKLVGQRYGNDGLDIQQKQKTREAYRVRVYEEPSGGRKAARTVLSPLVVTAQGVIVMVGVPVLILVCTVSNCRLSI